MGELASLKRADWLQSVNGHALAVAVGNGDKKARQQLKKIGQESQLQEKKAGSTMGSAAVPLWKLSQVNATESTHTHKDPA